VQFSESLKILRNKFIEENKEIFDKIEESKKTGTFKSSNFDQIYLKHFLEIFEASNFYSTKLLQLYEEILYLYHFFHYTDYSIKVKDYYKNNDIDTELLVKKAQSIVQIITAKNVIEKHIKKLAEEIGIKNLNTEIYDNNFISLKEYLTAIKSGKNKKLYHSGDEEFLVSKIILNEKGFIEEQLKIDNRIFYTFKSEHIIEMARVSKPGIYIIANIPYNQFSESAFYILFVTKGDAYLVDNNIHSLRNFISRNENRFIERRTNDTYLPWEIINNFIDNISQDKTLLDSKSDFSFRVIGTLSEINPTDTLGLISIIDTCLYTFSKTDFLKNTSVALKISMLDVNFLEKPENKSLILYKNHIPSITDLDLNWNPEKFNLPSENSGNYLESYIKKVPLDLKKIKRDELTSLEQIEKKIIYTNRQLATKKLEAKIKNDYNKNREKVLKNLTDFIRKQFDIKPEYYIKRALKDKEYCYTKYSQFGDDPETVSESIKEKILSIKYNYKTIYGNQYWAKIFHIAKHENCNYCNKYHGRYEFLLRFKDIEQFIEFFELSEKEYKKLPIQMRKYFNQARTLYDGNSILNDLDPITNIENPWWGGDNPYIVISFNLCGFCYRKFKRKLKNDIQKKI